MKRVEETTATYSDFAFIYISSAGAGSSISPVNRGETNESVFPQLGYIIQTTFYAYFYCGLIVHVLLYLLQLSVDDRNIYNQELITLKTHLILLRWAIHSTL